CAQFCAPPRSALVALGSAAAEPQAPETAVQKDLSHAERYRRLPAKQRSERLLTVKSLVRIRPGEPSKLKSQFFEPPPEPWESRQFSSFMHNMSEFTLQSPNIDDIPCGTHLAYRTIDERGESSS